MGGERESPQRKRRGGMEDGARDGRVVERCLYAGKEPIDESPGAGKEGDFVDTSRRLVLLRKYQYYADVEFAKEGWEMRRDSSGLFI